MARFSRMSARLHPVNTKKHIVDEQGGLIGGTGVSTQIAHAVDAPTLANTDEVIVGSYIRSFFLNFQAAATGTGALANIYLIIWKNPSNAIGGPTANAVGASDVKKLVFHQEMQLLERNTTGIPRSVFKGVLKVPAHMQRMGQDDKIKLDFLSPGVNMDYCFQAIYKEIR